MQNQLQLIIELIKKTSDKAIVLEGDKPAYVIMALKDYEKLLLDHSEVRGLTENELLDKINREVAVWKSDQEKVKEIEEEYAKSIDEEPWSRDFDLTEDRISDRIGSDLNFDDFETDFDDFGLEKAPWDSKESDFEEDKYYVEPVR